MKSFKGKKGISLIVLVITIIVMIILVAAVILSLNSNGIIGKAGDAQTKWNEAHQKELNQMEDIEKTIAGYTVGTAQTQLTKENVTDYLGKVVTNYTGKSSVTIGEGEESATYTVSTTYRLYYVDFDNKYGDGAGTIYLKADCTGNNHTLKLDTTSADAENVKIKNLNPALYAKNVTSPTATNNNMKAVTWLTNTSNWEGLKDTSTVMSGKINYVVGAPSLEMMMDSYNTYYGLTNGTLNTGELTENSSRVKLFYKYPYPAFTTGDTNNYGYAVGPSSESSAIDGYYYYTSDYTVGSDSKIDSMYWPGAVNYSYWLASPSASDSNSVVLVYEFWNGNINNAFVNSGDSALCPVVSLKADTQLELQ